MFEDYIGKTIVKIENRDNELSIEFEDNTDMIIRPLGTIEEEGESQPAALLVFMGERGKDLGIVWTSINLDEEE